MRFSKKSVTYRNQHILFLVFFFLTPWILFLSTLYIRRGVLFPFSEVYAPDEIVRELLPIPVMFAKDGPTANSLP